MAERTTSLRPSFSGNYSKGWAFSLPKAFKDALDIKHETRRENKEPYDVWTQGENFDFRKGDVLYNSKLAYELEWGDARPRLRYMVEVLEANPAIIDLRKSGTVDEGLVVFRFSRFLSPDGEVDPGRPLKCTQAEFVQFLETGFLVTKNFHFDIEGNLGPASELIDDSESEKNGKN